MPSGEKRWLPNNQGGTGELGNLEAFCFGGVPSSSSMREAGCVVAALALHQPE